MKINNLFYVALLFLFLIRQIGGSSGLFAQAFDGKLKPMRGIVMNSENGELIMGVHVYAKIAHQGAVSDQQGVFNMTVDALDTLVVTFVGFKKQIIPLAFFRDSPIEVIIQLESETIYLPGVTIYGETNIDYLKRPNRTAMRIPGLPAPAPKPDVDVPVGSLSYGVLSRWGKEAKEKRKMMKVYSADAAAIVYSRTVSSDSVRAVFMNRYDINEKQYNDFVIFFNTLKPLVDLQDPEDIVRVMHQTFLRYKPKRD